LQKAVAKVRILFRKTKPAHSFFILIERFSSDLGGVTHKKPHRDPQRTAMRIENAYT
jgi:hypothetical protein